MKDDPKALLLLIKSLSALAKEKGHSILSLVLLNDFIIKEGGYPTNKEINRGFKKNCKLNNNVKIELN